MQAPRRGTTAQRRTRSRTGTPACPPSVASRFASRASNRPAAFFADSPGPVVDGVGGTLDLLPVGLLRDVRGQQQPAEHGLHLREPEGVLRGTGAHPVGDNAGGGEVRGEFLAEQLDGAHGAFRARDREKPGFGHERDLVAGGPGHPGEAVQGGRAIHEDQLVVLRAGQHRGEPAQVAAAQVGAVVDAGVGGADGHVQDGRGSAGGGSAVRVTPVPPSRWEPRCRPGGPAGGP